MRRGLVIAAVALPGLLLAALGVAHPHALAPSTAVLWWQLHVVLLPLFPLLAVALVVLLRGEGGALAWLARIAAYVYAVFYTALDVLAGIAAGYVTDRLQSGSQVALDLRSLGNALGFVGSWAFLAAAVLTCAVLLRRHGTRALAGSAALCAGAANVVYAHIYWPVGGLAMIAVAGGCAVLETVRSRRSTPR